MSDRVSTNSGPRVTGRRDWSPVIREVEKLLATVPDNALFYRTVTARNRFLESPETDDWTDADVDRYRLLADLCIAYGDCK